MIPSASGPRADRIAGGRMAPTAATLGFSPDWLIAVIACTSCGGPVLMMMQAALAPVSLAIAGADRGVAGVVQHVLAAVAAEAVADDHRLVTVGDGLALAVEVLVRVAGDVTDAQLDVGEARQRRLCSRIGLRGAVGDLALGDVG